MLDSLSAGSVRAWADTAAGGAGPARGAGPAAGRSPLGLSGHVGDVAADLVRTAVALTRQVRRRVDHALASLVGFGVLDEVRVLGTRQCLLDPDERRL